MLKVVLWRAQHIVKLYHDEVEVVKYLLRTCLILIRCCGDAHRQFFVLKFSKEETESSEQSAVWSQSPRVVTHVRVEGLDALSI